MYSAEGAEGRGLSHHTHAYLFSRINHKIQILQNQRQPIPVPHLKIVKLHNSLLRPAAYWTAVSNDPVSLKEKSE